MKPDRTTREPALARGAVPLVGHALRLLRDPLRFLESLHADGELLRVALGPRTAYVVCSPELVHELLVNNRDCIVGGSLWDRLEALTGQGVANSNGDLHRRQRLTIQPSFRPERIAGYAESMVAEGQRAAESWRAGQVIDVPNEMFNITVRIAAHSFFGYQGIAEQAQRMVRALDVVFAGLYRRMVSPTDALNRLPLPANRRFDKALSGLHQLVDEMIAQRRDSGATREDLLQALLDERDEHGDPLGDQEIHDQVVSILVAGTETAASTMSWAFHLLSRHPKQEQRLHRELAPVAADHPINYTDLRSLPHLTNVITEALRIHPAGWIFTRRSVRETTLGDYRIPAGADIIYSPYALHRDPRHFERPAEFDPDRWTRERAAGIPRFAMIPFGAGNRKCPGDGYGMAEASLVVAAIASRWRLAPTPRTNADPQPHVLMSPKRLEMRVLPLA